MKKRWTFINKVDAISNVPCIRIIQELGISLPPLNTFISNWDTLLKVCKWRVNPEKDDNAKTLRGRNGMYGMVSSKMDSSFTSCASKEMFCVQECVKITEGT